MTLSRTGAQQSCRTKRSRFVRGKPTISSTRFARMSSVGTSAAHSTVSRRSTIPMPMFAIVDRDSQSVVGRVWCRRGTRPPEVGYFLREDAWGNGYATRALMLTTEWLLGAGGYTEVVLCTHPDNEQSHKVAARCGFVADGIIDEYALFKDGTRRALRFVRAATRLQ